MTYRLQNLMLAMLLALTTLFVGFGTLSQNPTSGGYQLFDRAASGISADIQLASLGNSAPPPETASEYANAPNRVPTTGSVADANFAQNNLIPPTKSFSDEGIQFYSGLAGRPINTVGELTDALRTGAIRPDQVPLDYVQMNGASLILNTRTSTALTNAGIPKSQWLGRNQTGATAFTKPDGTAVTFNDLASQQLNNNGLPPTGAPNLPGQ